MAGSEETIKTKLYTWYICTECSQEQTMKSPCVIMMTGRSHLPLESITQSHITAYRADLKRNLSCVSTLSKNKPAAHTNWREISFNDLMDYLSADPRVMPESRAQLPPRINNEKEQPSSAKTRFSDIDIV
jgi:hypothetical protein